MNSASDVFKDIACVSVPNSKIDERVLKRIKIRAERALDFSIDWTCHQLVTVNEVRDFIDFCTFLQSSIINGYITKNAAHDALQDIINIYPENFDIFDNLSQEQEKHIEFMPTALKMTITHTP